MNSHEIPLNSYEMPLDSHEIPFEEHDLGKKLPKYSDPGPMDPGGLKCKLQLDLLSDSIAYYMRNNENLQSTQRRFFEDDVEKKSALFISKIAKSSPQINKKKIADKTRFGVLGKVAYFAQKIKKQVAKHKLDIKESRIFRIINDATHLHQQLKHSPSPIPVIPPTATILILFNILMMCCIVIQIFAITLEIFFCYECSVSSRENMNFSYTLFHMSKIVFFLGVIIKFNMGFFEGKKIVISRSRILRRYASNELLADILGLVCLFSPYSISANSNMKAALLHSNINIYKMLYLLNLKQLQGLYEYFKSLLCHKKQTILLLSLLKLAFEILLAGHLFACVWNVNAEYQELVYGNQNTWRAHAKLLFLNGEALDWEDYYLYSLFWSLSTILTSGNADNVRNNNEVGLSIFVLILGSLIFAYGIKIVSDIVDQAQHTQKAYWNELRDMNKFMENKNISFGLKLKIRNYLKNHWKEKSGREAQAAVFDKLTTSMKKELLISSHWKIIEYSTPLVNYFSKETLEKMCIIMKCRKFNPGENIFKENQPSTRELYFLEKGSVQALVQFGHKQNKRILSVLKAGQCFGYENFFKDSPFSYSAKSQDFCTLYTISAEELKKVLDQGSDDWENFHKLKDELLLYNDKKSFQSGCFSCRDLDHNFKECPRIRYIPDIRRVLQKHLMYKPQLQRRPSKRRAKLRFSPLKRIKSLEKIRALFIENNMHSLSSSFNYDMLFPNSIEWVANSKSEEAPGESSLHSSGKSESHLKKEGTEELLKKSERRTLMRKSVTSEPHSIDQGQDGEKEKPEMDLVLKSSRLKEFKLAPISESATFYDKTDELESTLLKISLNKDYLDMHKLYFFKHYFPHNNCDVVIHNINKRRKKILKKRTGVRTNSKKQTKNDSIFLNNAFSIISRQPQSVDKNIYLQVPENFARRKKTIKISDL